MSGTVNYYGIDQSFKTVEYGPVTIEQAIQAVNDRFAKLKPKYASAEEAIAETMFGFNRAKDTFIEICINDSDEISFKFEFPLSKKFLIFQNIYQKESKLTSRDEVLERVRHFFSSTTPQEYKNYLEGLKKK